MPLDFGLVQDWIGGLLQNKGAWPGRRRACGAARCGGAPPRVCVCWCIGTDLYRMKGVLNVQHATQKFVYHAVHMIFNGAAPHISPYLAHDLQRCSSSYLPISRT